MQEVGQVSAASADEMQITLKDSRLEKTQQYFFWSFSTRELLLGWIAFFAVKYLPLALLNSLKIAACETVLCCFDSPVQKNFSRSVVLLSFISHFALVQQQIDSNMAGSQKKIWTGWDC